jgi:hypothetical protein
MKPEEVEAHFREISLNTSERKGHLSEKRAEQVLNDFNEKSKINFFIFSIMGAMLALNPSSLKNSYTLAGIVILVINAIVFGWIAQTVQRAINIKYIDGGMKDTSEAYKPLQTAYHLPSPEREAKFAEALEVFRKWFLARADSFAPRTILGNSWCYFTLLIVGLILLGVGVYKNLP